MVAYSCFVDMVPVTAEEYALLPPLGDPDYDAAMERFWDQVDPAGERRSLT